jgi:protein-S-isoprenylcysteine O-methyltransferase Ste14
MMRPHVRIPPLVIVVVAALLMWLSAWLLPWMRVRFDGQIAAAVALAVAGVLLSATGVVAFRRARTTVNPLTPDAASSLVVSGIYRFTRNPMYLGFAVILLGWAVFLAHPIAVLVLPGFAACMNHFQIGPEEQALEARFGDEFRAYAARVRRWI